MSRSFTARQALTAAFVANALRPVAGRRTAIASFVAGWLTTELAPQLLALTAGDTAEELLWRGRRGGHGARGRRGGHGRRSGRGRRGGHGRRGRPDKVGLALAAGSMAALGSMVIGARATADEIEGSLGRELGRSYLDRVE